VNARAAVEDYARAVDFTVEADAEAGLALKLQTDEWEVNVYGSADDLLALRDIRAAVWSERQSIQAGHSAGARVFWASAGDGGATLMIGSDDETWDIAVAVPLSTIDEIVEKVRTLTAHPPL
jgi:hypothetical protein